MKKILVLSLLLGAAVAAMGQAPQAAPARQGVDMAKFKLALTESRRKLFAAGMSNLTPQQLEAFWAVYPDYEKEKDAITGSRLDLAKRYAEGFASLSDAEIAQMVKEAADTQKQSVDLRTKYFGIYSQKINPKAAGRFFLIDDYITTALRLSVLDQMPLLGEQPRQ